MFGWFVKKSVSVPGEYHCRICLENMDVEQGYTQLCRCTSPIHEKCLRTWIQTSQKDVCEVCKTGYKIPVVIPPSKPPLSHAQIDIDNRFRESMQTLGCISFCILLIALIMLILKTRN